jgi:molecular chaperone DnaK (HSP70)
MTELAIGVYQGEHWMAGENHFLGTYRCNIEPGPEKSAEVNITFEATPSGLRMLDEDDGILWQGDAS